MSQRDPQTYAIIGAAMEVHRILGGGFLEAVYHDALEHEFRLRGIPFVREPTLRIQYKDLTLAAAYRPDFVCFDHVVVELKAIRALGVREDAQVIHYLRATGLPLALLLNFSSARLDYQRFAL